MRSSRSFAVLRRSFVLCGLGLGTVACGDRAMTITVDTASARAKVIVTGMRVKDPRRLRVTVLGDTTHIAGRTETTDSGLFFEPRFPFDRGRDYEAVIDGGRVVTRFRLPAIARDRLTRVTTIYPTADTLPENLLRIYVEFSAPMSREGGLPFVKLVDSEGREVPQAFLPLEADFWNADRTRYTLFLDPGRVKRGILPNEQMGRALVRGRQYSITVDSAWRDGNGEPIVAPFVKRFRVSAADYERVSPASWELQPPGDLPRSPLIVRFNEPLDRGLLMRAMGVETAGGGVVDGRVEIPAGEREWRFMPLDPWRAGDYRVVILDFLEDLAGNRVDRAFEVDLFQRADSSPAPTRRTIPIRVK